MAASKNDGVFESLGDLSVSPPAYGSRGLAATSTPQTRELDRMLSHSFTYGVKASSKTPLDMIRGFDESFNSAIGNTSLDLNATYPAPKVRSKMHAGWFDEARRGSRGLHMLVGKALNTYNFSPLPGNSFGNSSMRVSMSPWNMSRSRADVTMSPLRSMISSRASCVRSGAPVRNPNKALITISPSGKILIANQVACTLFGFQSSELVGMNLSSLVRRDNLAKGQHLIEELLIDDAGSIEQINGRVMVGIHSNSEEFAISIWLRTIDNDGSAERRFVTVIEPVIRVELQLVITRGGAITWSDELFCRRFGYTPEQLKGSDHDVTQLIPALRLGGEMNTPQYVTCMGSKMAPTPCTIILTPSQRSDAGEAAEGRHISGGSVGTSQSVTPTKDSTPVPCESDELLCTMHVYTTLSGLISCNDDGTIYGFNENFVLLLLGYTEDQVTGKPVTCLLPSIFEEMRLRGPLNLSGLSINENDPPKSKFVEGMYQGTAKHTDGSLLAVLFQIRTITVGSGELMHCIWLSADCLSDDANAASEQSQIEDSQPENLEEVHVDSALEEKMRAEQGLTSKYTPMTKLGEGSFGYVERCLSNRNGQQYVVKFIRKDKVLGECWEPHDQAQVPLDPIEDDFRPREIPREIVLLYSLDNVNIVKAVDVTHNPWYFHVVMEDHGPNSFDLFQYIEDYPDLDESVASHLFRQVTLGIEYLHERSILHRDVKDENVILNTNLDAKLIDFGSAAYIREGKLFDTFCGTIEYCAPEVLEGNPYPGPELEVFSMGVTLYTLLFGENPFCDIEETIAGVVSPPHNVSDECQSLLMSVLEPNPTQRAKIPEILRHPWIAQDVSEHIRAVTNKLTQENVRRESTGSALSDLSLAFCPASPTMYAPKMLDLMQSLNDNNLSSVAEVVISEEMDLETLLTLSESDIHDLGIEGEEATKLVQFIASHS